MKAAEAQRRLAEEEEKHKAAEKRREEKRLEREVRCVSYFMDVDKNMRQNTESSPMGRSMCH